VVAFGGLGVALSKSTVSMPKTLKIVSALRDKCSVSPYLSPVKGIVELVGQKIYSFAARGSVVKDHLPHFIAVKREDRFS